MERSHFLILTNIYFQNIRIRKTIASEPLTDVYTPKFHVICFFQKLINISCINYNRFPRTCLVYIAEKISDAKSHEEGSLIAVYNRISGILRRPNL
jgi:hypothetical protein